MSDKIPVDENDVIDLRVRWREDDQKPSQTSRTGSSPNTQRRAILFGLPVLVVLVTMLLLIVMGGKDPKDRLEGSAAGSRSETTTPVTPSSKVTPPTTTETPTTATTGTTVPGTPLSLPPADPDLPPQEAIGYFRDGKLYLEGSVPDLASATGYLKKAVDVLGAGNAFMNLKLDPRSPPGPARVIVEERFRFPSGSTEIDPAYKTLLGVGAYALEKIPEATLVITGYTDDVGDAEENRVLSQRRAQVIVDFMVANGIPADRVIAIGRGEADPIADNTTPEGREENRRIEGSLEGIMP